MAADFSDVTSLRTKLEESEVDYSCPTLVLAECALVYANADKVRAVKNKAKQSITLQGNSRQ